jgi:Na+/H+-dicarboxylate symporter
LSLFERYRRLSLGGRILAFMAVGVAAGLALGERAAAIEPLGEIFIRLLMMAALPLVFFNLLAALSGMSDARLLGRLGLSIFLFYALNIAIAVALGITLTSWLRPGDGITLKEPAPTVAAPPALGDVLTDLVPTNVVQAFAEGKIAQIVVFTVLLGVASLLLPEERRARLDGLFRSAAEAFRSLVSIVLLIAPFGIGALAAVTVGRYGTYLFGPLARFLGAVYLGHGLVAALYAASVALFARTSPIAFFRSTGTLYATAAATCSSLASLAVALDLAEKRLGLPRAVYSFTLPLGAQIGKAGTAVMLASVVLFTAQASGIELDAAILVKVFVVGFILSMSSAGIPGGGLVTAFVFVQSFGLSLEVAAIVGGMYRLIDVGNTTVNCAGAMVGTFLVSRTEGLQALSETAPSSPG